MYIGVHDNTFIFLAVAVSNLHTFTQTIKGITVELLLGKHTMFTNLPPVSLCSPSVMLRAGRRNYQTASNEKETILHLHCKTSQEHLVSTEPKFFCLNETKSTINYFK
jgi:hypothetical protein